MEAAVVYNREEINQKIPYQVIVENWEKKNSGMGRRMWEEEFSFKERASIASYVARFRKWYLTTGTPKECTFVFRNLILIRRAGNFFASI